MQNHAGGIDYAHERWREQCFHVRGDARFDVSGIELGIRGASGFARIALNKLRTQICEHRPSRLRDHAPPSFFGQARPF